MPTNISAPVIGEAALTGPRAHISVVVPAYNEQEYIRHCLDALSRQTVQPDIIYIVDNNSTDATVQIAKEYPSVQVITEPVQGICAATKTGLDTAAKHDGIILRCDADSRPEATWVEKLSHTFEQNVHIAAITGPGVPYDTGRVGRLLFSYFYMKPYFFFTKLALGVKPLFGSNLAIRASSWKTISSQTHLAQHQDIHDDIDISYHLVDRGVMYYDKHLRMPISARPFRSPRTIPTRYAAGFRSIFLHWPSQAPWKRHIK